MVVLADEILESFFETDLSASFRLDPVPELELPPSNTGLLGDIWSQIATDSNKKMFNMFTDEIGKSIGKHQVKWWRWLDPVFFSFPFFFATMRGPIKSGLLDVFFLIQIFLFSFYVGHPSAFDWEIHQT